MIKAPRICMIGGLGYSSHGASDYLRQEQRRDSNFKSLKGIPAHTARCIGMLWDSSGPQAAPTPLHRHPPPKPWLVFNHPTAKPSTHGAQGSSPAPRDINRKVFFNLFLHQRSLLPTRCGWDEGRAYFPVKHLDCPLVFVFFLPSTGAKCQP